MSSVKGSELIQMPFANSGPVVALSAAINIRGVPPEADTLRRFTPPRTIVSSGAQLAP